MVSLSKTFVALYDLIPGFTSQHMIVMPKEVAKLQ